MPDLTPTEIHDRTDGPIHGFFGLSYSNYLVLHRTLMQSMPVAWQERAVELFGELDAAFAHIERPDTFDVRPGRDSYYNELTGAEMTALNIVEDDDGLYLDHDGTEHQGHDHVLVPLGEDPVPHYNRGRTFVAPNEAQRPNREARRGNVTHPNRAQRRMRSQGAK